LSSAAFNTGPDFHLLDHIAPIAAALQIPLITTEERNFELARRYYPQVELRYMPDLELKLSSIAEEFDALFECKYWLPHLKSLFRELYGKDMRLVFCPHGQSDKGFKAPLLAPYANQDMVLLYGELLIQMLQDLNVWPSIASYAIVGNYRLEFYQKHQSFYDDLTEKEFPLDPKKRTLLYAPTWRDLESSSSFFQYGAKIISELPTDWNLIIKVHPLLEQRDPAYFYSITALTEKKPNAILIHEFPPVYPLLAKADIYLGDASSVGYDFLYFERPLYFLPSDYPGKLHPCGSVIDPEKPIYSQLDASNHYKQSQKSLYQLAFGIQLDDKTLRTRIEKHLLCL
jgi:hypothetical protein